MSPHPFQNALSFMTLFWNPFSKKNNKVTSAYFQNIILKLCFWSSKCFGNLFIIKMVNYVAQSRASIFCLSQNISYQSKGLFLKASFIFNWKEMGMFIYHNYCFYQTTKFGFIKCFLLTILSLPLEAQVLLANFSRLLEWIPCIVLPYWFVVLVWLSMFVSWSYVWIPLWVGVWVPACVYQNKNTLYKF